MVGRWSGSVALLFAFGLVVAGCEDDDEVFSATDRDSRFDVAVGETVLVVLESNRSTGYAWALVERPPRTVLRLVDDRYLQPDTDLLGAAGYQELTFEAVGDGSTYIQLWYVRSFDDPPEPSSR